MAANFYPDGSTVEVITALQSEVDKELRQEGICRPADAVGAVVDADRTNRHTTITDRRAEQGTLGPWTRPAGDAYATRRGKRRTRERGADRVVA